MGKQIYVAKIFENMFLFRGLEAVAFISPLLLILFFCTFMHTNNEFRLLLPLPIPVSLLSQSTSFPLYESLFLIHVFIFLFQYSGFAEPLAPLPSILPVDRLSLLQASWSQVQLYWDHDWNACMILIRWHSLALLPTFCFL